MCPLVQTRISHLLSQWSHPLWRHSLLTAGSIFAYNQAGLCTPGWTPGLPGRSPCSYSKKSEELVITVVKALWLSKDSTCFPIVEHISVLHAGSHGAIPSLNRRNILKGTTWAVPFGPIAIHKTDRFLIRTPEDQELVSDQWTIKALAEGETWVETMNGCRLPASVVAKKTSVYTKKDLPFVDAETWKASNPEIICALWRNERLQRTRLLEAEYRDGLSDMRPVGETLPGR